jgi:hypothetical protein
LRRSAGRSDGKTSSASPAAVISSAVLSSAGARLGRATQVVALPEVDAQRPEGLGLTESQVRQFHDDARAGSPRLPGAVRAGANRATSMADVVALGSALRAIAGTTRDVGRYRLDDHGQYVPRDRRTPAAV